MITYVIKLTELKFEVIFGLWGCLEAIVASEPAKRTHMIAVLIVDAGLWGHCPLVSIMDGILGTRLLGPLYLLSDNKEHTPSKDTMPFAYMSLAARLWQPIIFREGAWPFFLLVSSSAEHQGESTCVHFCQGRIVNRKVKFIDMK